MTKVQDIDHGWKAMQRKLLELRGTTVSVGFPEDKQHGDAGMSVAELAAIHEFGLSVPQRAFLAPTLDEGRTELAAFMRDQALAVVDGRLSATQAIGRLGEKAKGMVQKTLRDKRPEWPALSEETKRRKAARGRLNSETSAEFVGGDGNPLIDTGQLINSVQWVAVKKGVPGV